MGFAALILALSFLGASTIELGDLSSGGHGEKITGYGLGYFLWVTSIGIFSIGQLLAIKIKKDEKLSFFKVIILQCVFLMAVLFSYYAPSNSMYKFNESKQAVFSERCEKSIENVSQKIFSVKGIAFSRNYGSSYRKNKNDGLWYSSGERPAGYLLYKGLIDFYEIKTSPNGEGLYEKYIRKVAEDPDYRKPISLSSNRMSEYFVEIVPYESEREFNLYGETITVSRSEDNVIIATTSYVYDRTNKIFCGPSINDEYSQLKFMARLLDSQDL
jgi:hypothetical protein